MTLLFTPHGAGGGGVVMKGKGRRGHDGTSCGRYIFSQAVEVNPKFTKIIEKECKSNK